MSAYKPICVLKQMYQGEKLPIVFLYQTRSYHFAENSDF